MKIRTGTEYKNESLRIGTYILFLCFYRLCIYRCQVILLDYFLPKCRKMESRILPANARNMRNSIFLMKRDSSLF